MSEELEESLINGGNYSSNNLRLRSSEKVSALRGEWLGEDFSVKNDQCLIVLFC